MNRIRRLIRVSLVCLIVMGLVPMTSAAQPDLMSVEVPQGFFLIVSDETTMRVWEGSTDAEGNHRQVRTELATTDYAPIFRAELASQVYCSWASYAKEQGWDLQYEGQSYDWMACSVPSDGTDGATTTSNRRITGEGGVLPFYPGESVEGAVITLDTGEVYTGCHFSQAPTSGSVMNGVINGPPEEYADTPSCEEIGPSGSPSQGSSSDETSVQIEVNRRISGNGGTIEFWPGEDVVGSQITLDTGEVFYECYLANAPSHGTVFNGVVNPFWDEVQVPTCGQPSGGENPPAEPVSNRRETGPEGTTEFWAGESVLGSDIRLEDGSRFTECYLAQAPSSGTVFNGVVNPTGDEVAGKPACSEPVPQGDEPQTPPPSDRQTTGPEGTLSFTAGATVLGSTITLDTGEVFYECYLQNALSGGTVFNGVINPYEDEIAGKPACSPPEPTPEPTTETSEPATDTRRESGEGGILEFSAGDVVTGAYIQLSDGSEATNCSLNPAPQNGWVTSGVVNPYPEEMGPDCIFEPTEVTDEVPQATEEVTQAPTEEATATTAVDEEVATEEVETSTPEPTAVLPDPTEEVTETVSEEVNVPTETGAVTTEEPVEDTTSETQADLIVTTSQSEGEVPSDTGTTEEVIPTEVPVDDPVETGDQTTAVDTQEPPAVDDTQLNTQPIGEEPVERGTPEG